jgi:hypothetical protein
MNPVSEAAIVTFVAFCVGFVVVWVLFVFLAEFVYLVKGDCPRWP